MKHTRILCVANKRLPNNDYRIQFRTMSSRAQVTFALPGKPASLSPCEFVELPFGEGIGLSDVRNLFALLILLWRNRRDYDLIHFFSTKLQLFGAMCAALVGTPCVTTITGFGRTFNRDELRYRMLRPLYLFLTRLSLQLSQATFFQNYGDMRWLAKRHPSLSHKMHWIGSGVEAEVVQNKNFGDGPLNVLMVARLMPDKGVPIFLQTAEQLCSGQFRFQLAGPCSIGEEALYRKVLKAHDQRTIEYLGELEQAELQKRYREGHVLAFPSRYGEGMPRVMLEAGHALMCPVASDIPAHRDLIQQGRGFSLAIGQEVDSLVCHLQWLNANRAELEQHARSYQEFIVRNYSIEAYSNRMDDFLSQIMSATDRSVDRSKVAA